MTTLKYINKIIKINKNLHSLFVLFLVKSFATLKMKICLAISILIYQLLKNLIYLKTNQVYIHLLRGLLEVGLSFDSSSKNDSIFDFYVEIFS